jgi:hypothetical protein
MPTQFYSDLFGAAIVGDPSPQLVTFKAASGVVPMGAVVALVADQAELVTSLNQATVFGIALHDVDTTSANPNGSVARRGSYKAESLVVSAGVDSAALETALRDVGILLEGRIVVPVALAAKAPEEPEPERPVASAESMARRQREEDEARRHHHHKS